MKNTSSERELKSSELLPYIEIIAFFVTIDLCYPYGMMEWWNSGVLRIKSGKNRFSFFLPVNPSFQCSIIPIFQLE